MIHLGAQTTYAKHDADTQNNDTPFGLPKPYNRKPLPTMNAKLQPSQKAPDFTLPATDGSTVHLADELARHTAVVVMFLCNHCPYVKAYIPRLIQLQDQFPAAAPQTDKNGVRFLGICSNDAQTYPEDSFENMKKATREWAFNFPYLHDQDQSVARAYGAQRTPDIFLLGPDSTCRYEGAVDDNYQDPDRITQQPLRDAIQAIIAGKPITEPQTQAIGCTIKWKNS